MGAIDPVQMTQMARHQEAVYISGWAASSVLTTGNNEVGPDLAYATCFLLLLICVSETEVK
jgi:isocitrate lyase